MSERTPEDLLREYIYRAFRGETAMAPWKLDSYIADAICAAVEAERAACADICEEMAEYGGNQCEIADRIRARGKEER